MTQTTNTIDMSKAFNGVTLGNLADQLDKTCSAIVGAELSRSDLARMIHKMLGKSPAWAAYDEVRSAVCTTDDRKTTWNNGIATARKDFAFIVPANDSKAAVEKAAQREKAEKAASDYIASHGRPTAEQKREAAIQKETASTKEDKAKASLILAAAKLADKRDQDAEKEVRAEVLEMVKTADLKHLMAALQVLKAALPTGAKVEIKLPKAK